jgi:Flp pilus assembly pilin Flp
MASSSQQYRSLRSDRRGAIMVEYVTLLSLCAIGIAAAVLGWGPALVTRYETSQAILLSPFP